MICGEIGRFLRLPVPPCGVVYASDIDPSYWFASLDFNLVGEALPPVDPADCVKRLTDMATGIIVFDLLVGNPDRHVENISMDALGKPPSLNLFDHGVALFGSVEGEAERVLLDRRDKFVIGRHCLIRHLPGSGHFMKWTERVALLPDYFIDDICNETVSLGVQKAEARAAADFLKHRRGTIRHLIRSNQASFPGIMDWSLFP